MPLQKEAKAFKEKGMRCSDDSGTKSTWASEKPRAALCVRAPRADGNSEWASEGSRGALWPDLQNQIRWADHKGFIYFAKEFVPFPAGPLGNAVEEAI